MISLGGAGSLLFTIGLVGFVKNRPIEPLERTVIRGVENFTVFGAREWKYYYRNVGAQPDYPEDIVNILNAPCPFYGDETIKVKDTHMLVLMPAGLTLNQLRRLVEHPRNNGHRTCFTNDYSVDNAGEVELLSNRGNGYGRYNFYPFPPNNLLSNRSADQSRWLLMTKDVIPGSRNKTYFEQKQFVEQREGYRMPQALEAAIGLLMRHVISGNARFTEASAPIQRPLIEVGHVTYTRCSEVVNSPYLGGRSYSPLFAGFNDDGFRLAGGAGIDYPSDQYGVVALRSF